MLRTAARASVRPWRACSYPHRWFVSTVLLSKTYEDKTVADLRAELRARGLSVSGSKATLITRMQRADTRSVSEEPSSSTPVPTPSHSQTRSVASSSASRVEAAQSAISRSPAPPVSFNIKLPDVSQPSPEPSVQIPFVPDFWESSAKKARDAAAAAALQEPLIPKIMLVAGAETHPAGGPTYAMSPALDTIPSAEPPSPPKKYDGLLGDVLDDLGVPHNVLAATPISSETTQGLAAKRNLNRPLDEEERRGAITLLGLFLGAWVVAGIAAPSQGKSRKQKAH